MVKKEINNGVINYIVNEVDKIIVCGDIHGEYNNIVNKICMRYEITNALIIFAGDGGFGFNKPRYYDNVYAKNKNRLEASNNYLMFVRGNHDNPHYFNDEYVKHPRFMTVPDYSVITCLDKQILCVGGAISIDRVWRMNTLKPNVYWDDEAPVFDVDKLNLITESFNITSVITHTAPSFCEFISKDGLKDFAEGDSKLLDDCAKERQTMDDILSYLKEHNHNVYEWCYGHFHSSWSAEIDSVKFTMLGIDELKMITY